MQSDKYAGRKCRCEGALIVRVTKKNVNSEKVAAKIRKAASLIAEQNKEGIEYRQMKD